MRAALLILGLAASVGAAAGSGPGEADIRGEFTPEEIKRILRHTPLGDAPAGTSAFSSDPRAARLGQFLFFDKRLSINGEVACATCHDPEHSFADGKPLAQALGTSTRHTPALWNVAYNRWYFWDGRADSLWSQALHPVEHALEMGSSRLRVAHLVHDDALLRRAYEAIFGPLPDLDDRARFPADGRPVLDDPAHPHHGAWTAMSAADQDEVNRIFANLGKAIAAYESHIVSRRAAFDTFAEGLRSGDVDKQNALSAAARRGLRLFIGRGECRLCHSGPNFSDGEFHDIRVPPAHPGPPRDPGRFEGVPRWRADPFNAAGRYSDDPTGESARRLEFLVNGPQNWGRFKTPTLRNVARTAPYMHQGQFAALPDVLEYYSTLKDAVVMDHHDETILVPRHFTAQEKDDLVAFLESLSDESIDPSLRVPPPSPLP